MIRTHKITVYNFFIDSYLEDNYQILISLKKSLL